ncbi:MAG: radical SAM protein [Candidatus Buchananbacteria bacterium]
MMVKRFDSNEKTVSKYVFEFEPAGVAESVLYKYPDFETRTVICCSTQSGCPVGCIFCGTGSNFVRSLTAEEIVAQPVYLMQDRNINANEVQRLQIMFMSMGEPLLNYEALAEAIRQLHKSYPNAELLISTSAPRIDFEPLRVLSSEITKIGLQFSVHESTDETRDKLIPFKNKLTLREIAAEGIKWHEKTGKTPFFNYCVHTNNMSEQDADRLLELFDPSIWRATLSVICEKDESVASATARQLEISNNFRSKLQKRGFDTQVFNPAGQDDIGGGCGQLWYVQKWMKDHPGSIHKIISK